MNVDSFFNHAQVYYSCIQAYHLKVDMIVKWSGKKTLKVENENA